MEGPTSNGARAVFARRLKMTRQAAGLSQKALGVRIGLPEDVAGVRINRYEREVHDCDSETALKIAKELSVPLSYLYEDDDNLATLILGYSRIRFGHRTHFMAHMTHILNELDSRPD